MVSSTDSYGAAGVAAFETAAADVGLFILASITFALNAADFSSQYARIRDGTPTHSQHLSS